MPQQRLNFLPLPQGQGALREAGAGAGSLGLGAALEAVLGAGMGRWPFWSSAETRKEIQAERDTPRAFAASTAAA